jgi:hypothetical protein
MLPFESERNGERTNWHYIRRERKGLALKDMAEPPRVFAMALLKSGLSDDGLAKAQAIQSLEEILRVMEKSAPAAASSTLSWTKPWPTAWTPRM